MSAINRRPNFQSLGGVWTGCGRKEPVRQATDYLTLYDFALILVAGMRELYTCEVLIC